MEYELFRIHILFPSHRFRILKFIHLCLYWFFLIIFPHSKLHGRIFFSGAWLSWSWDRHCHSTIRPKRTAAVHYYFSLHYNRVICIGHYPTHKFIIYWCKSAKLRSLLGVEILWNFASVFAVLSARHTRWESSNTMDLYQGPNIWVS